jgi:hypothetical protein
MNRSTTACHFHSAVFFLIGLLCLCIAMQILGAPISLWDIHQSVDLAESSPLEELSLPSTAPELSVARYRKFYAPSPPLEYDILLAQSFFHPPLSHA